MRPQAAASSFIQRNSMHGMLSNCHLRPAATGRAAPCAWAVWRLEAPNAWTQRAAAQHGHEATSTTVLPTCRRRPRRRTGSSVVAAAQPPSSPAALSSKQQKGPEQFQYLELDLPPPANTKVASARLAKSSVKASDGPPGRLPEFALIGRSNVGKSSMINSLASSQKLARVSKEPGMTKLINHYLINDSWYLVDLPGYGFAKTAGKAARSEWLEFTKQYFVERDALAHVLLLVDSSLPPQPVDVECANWLVECEVPFAVVFTKLDNRKKDGPTPQQNIRMFKTMLAKDFERLPWCFETSSRTGAGRTELLGYISSVRQMHEASGGM